MDENPYRSPETGGARRETSVWLLAIAALRWLLTGFLIIMMVVTGVAALMGMIFAFARSIE